MGLRLLVVEDQDDFADFVVRGLREEGLTAERAADTPAAWHALTTAEWGVVLLDRDDIDEMEPGKVSIMPAGLDQQLTKQELADLVAFLKACK
jgi:CheY-like chemotaxis protein